MTEESPFKSPEIVDEVQASFDKRSQELFRLARGLRWLEGACAFYVAGLAAPAMIIAEIDESHPDTISDGMAFAILIAGWILASLITGAIVFVVLVSLGFQNRYLWMPAVAGIPWISIVGVIFAARLIHIEMREYGLRFDWIGPSQKEIVKQLRRQDGSEVDPKTLGLKRE